MNYVPNQNGKVLEEMLADFNSDAVKITLRRLRYFKMTLSLLQVLQKSLPIPLLLCQTQQRALRMALYFKASHSNWQVAISGHLAWFSDPICYMNVHGPSLALPHPNS